MHWVTAQSDSAAINEGRKWCLFMAMLHGDIFCCWYIFFYYVLCEIDTHLEHGARASIFWENRRKSEWNKVNWMNEVKKNYGVTADSGEIGERVCVRARKGENNNNNKYRLLTHNNSLIWNHWLRLVGILSRNVVFNRISLCLSISCHIM